MSTNAANYNVVISNKLEKRDGDDPIIAPLGVSSKPTIVSLSCNKDTRSFSFGISNIDTSRTGFVLSIFDNTTKLPMNLGITSRIWSIFCSSDLTSYRILKRYILVPKTNCKSYVGHIEVSTSTTSITNVCSNSAASI